MTVFGDSNDMPNEIRKLHKEINLLRDQAELQPILTTGRSDDGFGASVGSKTMHSQGVWSLTPVIHTVNKLTTGATLYDMIELISACAVIDKNPLQGSSVTELDVKTIRMGSINEAGVTVNNSAPNGTILFIKPINGKKITLKAGGNIHISQDVTLDDKAFAILQFYVTASMVVTPPVNGSNPFPEENKMWVLLTGGGGTSVNAIKEPCRCATTGNNISPLAIGSTVDGTTIVVDDRVLYKNQLDTLQSVGSQTKDNGIYVCTHINGIVATMKRATDFDDNSEVKAGTIVTVNEGTANGNKLFMMTEDVDPIIVGTTDINFTLVTSVDTALDYVWTGLHKFQGDPTGNIGDVGATHTVEFGNTGTDRVRFIGEITGVGDAVITDPDGSGTYTIPNSDPSVSMKASVVMNTYTMYDLDTLVFSQAESTQTPAPLNNWVWIEADTGTGSSPVLTGMKYNVPSSKTHQFAVNGTNVVTIDSTGIVSGGANPTLSNLAGTTSVNSSLIMQNGKYVSNLEGVFFNTRSATPIAGSITYDGTDLLGKKSDNTTVNLTTPDYSGLANTTLNNLATTTSVNSHLIMQNGKYVSNLEGVFFNTRSATPIAGSITYDGTDLLAKRSDNTTINLTNSAFVKANDSITWTDKHVWDSTTTWSHLNITDALKATNCHAKFQGDGLSHQDSSGNWDTGYSDASTQRVLEIGAFGSHEVKIIAEVTGEGDAVITNPDGGANITIPNSDPSISFKASLVMNTYTMYDLDTLVFSQGASSTTPAPEDDWVFIEANTGESGSPVLTGMHYNVPTSKTHQFKVNGTEKLNISSDGIKLSGNATPNPLVNGMMWLNSTDNKIYARSNSATVELGSGSGGSADNLGNHTATQALNMNDNLIQGLNDMAFTISGQYLFSSSSGLQWSVPTGDTISFQIPNGTSQFTVSASTINVHSKKITNVTNPVSNQDVATKYYVDQNAGGGGANTSLSNLTSTGEAHFINFTDGDNRYGRKTASNTWSGANTWNGSTYHGGDSYIQNGCEWYLMSGAILWLQANSAIGFNGLVAFISGITTADTTLPSSPSGKITISAGGGTKYLYYYSS